LITAVQGADDPVDAESAGSPESVTPDALLGHGFPDVGVTVVEDSVDDGSVPVGSGGLPGAVVVVLSGRQDGDSSGASALSGTVSPLDSVMSVLVESSRGDVSE